MGLPLFFIYKPLTTNQLLITNQAEPVISSCQTPDFILEDLSSS